MARRGNIEGGLLPPMRPRFSYYRAPRRSGEGALRPLSTRVYHHLPAHQQEERGVDTRDVGIRPDDGALQPQGALSYPFPLCTHRDREGVDPQGAGLTGGNMVDPNWRSWESPLVCAPRAAFI